MPLIYRGFNLYGQEDIAELFLENHLVFNNSCSFAIVRGQLIYRGYNETQFDNKINAKNVTTITLNDERLLLLNENGGILKIELKNLQEIIEVPRLDLDEGDQIVKLSSGATLNVAVSRNGNLFCIPNKLTFNNKNIEQIQCGREHCLLLDKNGDLYSFGRGSRGQLGHSTLEDEEEPKLIEALAGIKIAKISAGYWHSCAISKDGDLYIWGWNSNGQLGLLDQENEDKEAQEKCVSVLATPQLVNFPEDLNVVDVGCGSRHTVVFLENSALYGCGWNKYKQINNEETENYYRFTYVHNFRDKSQRRIICGPWCTAILYN